MYKSICHSCSRRATTMWLMRCNATIAWHMASIESRSTIFKFTMFNDYYMKEKRMPLGRYFPLSQIYRISISSHPPTTNIIKKNYFYYQPLINPNIYEQMTVVLPMSVINLIFLPILQNLCLYSNDLFLSYFIESVF